MSRVVLSVVVATYNRLHELRAMLDSLLPQVSGGSVEVLIADDRSTDGTWEWLERRFAAEPGIHLFRTEHNSGPGPARNLCLAAANGQFFWPVDSDFIVREGAIDSVLAAIRDEDRYDLLLFPCLQFPAMRRIGGLMGRREVRYEEFVADGIGEVIPVARLSWIRSRNLAYPRLRAGGEGLLWAEMLMGGPALFIDRPIILYRTDVTARICTLEYQLAHPGDLAAVSDAMAALLSRNLTPALRSALARRYLAAGAYHLLAGDVSTGRLRLLSAVSRGSLPAVAALAASFAGRSLFSTLFRVYRTRLAKAYL